MAGGGFANAFKVVRYVAGPTSESGQRTLTTNERHVVLDQASRAKIAEALGITDPEEQARLSGGSVYIRPAGGDKPGS